MLIVFIYREMPANIFPRQAFICISLYWKLFYIVDATVSDARHILSRCYFGVCTSAVYLNLNTTNRW